MKLRRSVVMVIESPFFAAPKGEGCRLQGYFECPGDMSLRPNGVEAVRDGTAYSFFSPMIVLAPSIVSTVISTGSPF